MRKKLFTILKVYVFTWLISLLLFIIRGIIVGTPILDSIQYFGEALTRIRFIIAIHVLFIILYIIYLSIRYFIRIRRKKGIKVLIKHLLLRLCIPVCILYGIFKFIIIRNSSENYLYAWNYAIENLSGMSNDLYRSDGKHRGMSVFGWNVDNKEAVDDLVRSNIEWVAIIPFMYQEDVGSLAIETSQVPDQWSKRDSLYIKTIKELKNRNIHIMLKPHLWLGSGWRSNITQSSVTNWDTWFTSYRYHMIRYARMAAETEVELFCIGTELQSSLIAQPEQWKNLIKEIKTIYKGKLTYAANWDGEYDLIDFWDELDYIGLQAYFPLTKNPKPDLKAIKKGWDIHINVLESISQKYNKPILFTEIGYKSEASATIKPWEWGSFFSILTRQKSNKTQQIAYQGLFEKLWNKDWFAGTYIWQWNTRSRKENATTNLDFSPRYKPAENTIAIWYATEVCN